MRADSNLGVFALLANAKTTSSFEGARYYFDGDLCQIATARKIAMQLGIQTGIDGGRAFVMSKKDFERVTQHLIDYKIEGWWNYVTQEEYSKITGEC